MGYFIDRVQETSNVTGTLDAVLLGAPTGYQPFSTFGDGNLCAYAIVHPTLGQWEVGIATYHSSGNKLSRTTVLASSNSGSLVNFSAGTKTVKNTLPAELVVNGGVWRSGTGVPSNSLGLDGDLYLRTTTGDVYQRSSGVYSIICNITGPAGTGSGNVVGPNPSTVDAIPAYSNTTGTAIRNSTVLIHGGSHDKLQLNAMFEAIDTYAYAATITFDFDQSDIVKTTLTGNSALVASNVSAGQTVYLYIQQDGTGGRTVTWTGFGTILWDRAYAPVLDTAANGWDLIVLKCISVDGYGVPTWVEQSRRQGTNTGATANTRIAGGTVSGAPASGKFQIGDVVFDQSGSVWICTSGGTPGTWTASGSSSNDLLKWFGDGSDGDLTISSGKTSLSRDMFYNNLTINSTGVLNTAGYRVFVKGTLDISGAGAGAIICQGQLGSPTAVTPTAGTAGGNGNNSSGGTGGVSGTPAGTGNTIAVTPTCNGGAGGLSSGANADGLSPSPAFVSGSTGNGGTGGTNGVNSPGIGTNFIGVNIITFRRWTDNFYTPVTTTFCATPTMSGGGGDGDNGSARGGGGGGGGGSGGIIWISANTVVRGTNSNTGIIVNKGAAGGAGGNATTGNACGGGGGSGGSGGWVFIGYYSITGSSIANAIDVGGAAGGAGGNGFGTGSGGYGGGSGGTGRVTIINLQSQSVTDGGVTNGSSGSAPSGTSGGAGASANAKQVAI